MPRRNRRKTDPTIAIAELINHANMAPALARERSPWSAAAVDDGSPEAPAPRRWYALEVATAGDKRVAELLIYEPVGGWFGVDASDLVRELAAVEADEILVRINSPGGDVFDGLAIYNALVVHPANVVTRVEGMAASIASIIALAGNERQMFAASQLMIHSPWGVAVGNADELRELAGILDKTEGVLVDLYAARTNLSAAVLREQLKADRYMTPSEALEDGFVDIVLTGEPAKAAADEDDDDENLDAQGALPPTPAPVAIELIAAEGRKYVGKKLKEISFPRGATVPAPPIAAATSRARGLELRRKFRSSGKT